MSSSTSQPPPYVSISMPVQLTNWNNYLLWKSFIIPILKSHEILDLAEGRELCPPQFLITTEDNKEVENPSYTLWTKKDQTLLAVINASLSQDLLLRRAVGFTSGRALWLMFEDLYAREATTYLKQLKNRLENLKMEKADCSVYHPLMAKYVGEVKLIVNGLHAAGFPVEDREVVSRVVSGLPSEYEELTASVRDRPESVSREELYTFLLSLRLPESTGNKIRRRTCIAVCVLLATTLIGLTIWFLYITGLKLTHQ